MAVKLDNAHGAHKTEDRAEVASCVSGIIEAFTNGLNIFKRLRERRRKRKARKENQVADPASSPEQQLSRSLRRGPEELAVRYSECYHGGMGPRFAKGDAIAHASLAETLIKLNTGLVAIIATFLNHDSKGGKSHLDLDYKSLTHLSDASRREALQSMTQLYQRLSHSQLQLCNVGPPPCPRCGTTKHSDCSSRSSSPEKEKRKHSSTRQRSSGQVITRMPIKSSSQPQLVVMRPKTTRKGSNSSNNSSSSRSPPTSRTTSPLASPQPKKLTMAPQLPLYVPIEPFELNTPGVIKGTLGGGPNPSSAARPRIDSFDNSRPSTWPQQHDNIPPHPHDPVPKLPTFTSTSRRPSLAKPYIPPKPAHLSPPPPSATLPFRRRMDKMTPSNYTFASDSTKLGEIPQRHWTLPYDYEEADRLNAQAAVQGYPGLDFGAAGEKKEKEKEKEKKRRFGFLRRGGGDA
ncbi:hypothetical protein BDW02DRAFT_292626 [Decorospora gaudefroyi]|uniref:Uncharacterized protein n=1 Tax=Decorospora gaudefroyi TaxID=184978 RepID=A0A6A5KGX4_9PLEO|nr:hypothetical protein BDW02DRAFT_292626 [Decorospora gaudefroyi]